MCVCLGIFILTLQDIEVEREVMGTGQESLSEEVCRSHSKVINECIVVVCDSNHVLLSKRERGEPVRTVKRDSYSKQ